MVAIQAEKCHPQIKLFLCEKTGIGLPEMALPVLYLPAVTCRCKTNSRLKFTSRGLPAEVYQQRFTSIYLPVVKCHRGLLLAVVLPVFNFLHVRIISEIFQIWVCLSTLNLQCISYDRCTVLRLTIIKAFLKIHSNFKSKTRGSGNADQCSSQGAICHYSHCYHDWQKPVSDL